MAQDTEQAPDPVEVARIIGEVAERSSNVLGDFVRRHANGKGVAFTDEFGIARAFMDMWVKLAANPVALAQAQMSMYFDYLRLWQASWLKLIGGNPEPVAEPASGDARFKDEEWQSNFVFDYLKQSYLIAARHIHDAVSGVEVDAARMRRNLDASQGIVVAERVSYALTRRLGRADAHELVADATRAESFRDALLADERAGLSADEVDLLLDPATYIGAAEELVDRALAAYDGVYG